MSDENELLQRVKALAVDCPKLSHTFRFMISAILALRRSRTLGHKNRADYSDPDRHEHYSELVSTIDEMQAGGEPSQHWMAGFYYHAAIMRVDACYERFLVAMRELRAAKRGERSAQKRGSKTNALASHVEADLQLGAPFVRDRLEWNRDEVNRLKHELFGQEPTHAKDRQVSDLDNAYAALNQLLVMIESPGVLPADRRLGALR